MFFFKISMKNEVVEKRLIENGGKFIMYKFKVFIMISLN